MNSDNLIVGVTKRRRPRKNKKKRAVTTTLPIGRHLTNHLVYTAQANRDRSQPVYACRHATVKWDDLQTLQGREWLNGNVIAGYFYLLEERGKREHHSSVLTFNTDFFTALREQGFQKVQNWVPNDIFNYDMLLCPVHQNNHWTCLAFRKDNKTIYFFDSFGTTGTSQMDIFEQYINTKNVQTGRAQEVFSREYNNKKMQTNTWDCGVFVCAFAEAFSNGDFTPILAQSEMAAERKQIQLALLTGIIP